MSKILSLLTLSTFLGLIACNTDQKPAEDIAEVATDEAFQNKHETPEQIEFEGKGEMVTFDTPDGKTAKAYALKTDNSTDKYLFVFHEWWGLNDQIKQEAEHLFDNLDDVTVLAIDLYDGSVTDKREEAGKLVGSRDVERLRAIVQGAKNYAGASANIATIGWCFGGGWSIHSTLLLEDQAAGCVMYYGALPIETAQALPTIQTDVLGIFAEKDQHITLEYANTLKNFVIESGKQMNIHSFDADHAFANPSSPRYVEAAAQEANGLALVFLKERLK